VDLMLGEIRHAGRSLRRWRLGAAMAVATLTIEQPSKGVMAQNSASWNQVAGWLSRLGDLRAHFPALA